MAQGKPLPALVFCRAREPGARYQAGALPAIAELAGSRFPFPVIAGVSAGAINAVFLASCVGSPAWASALLCSGWRSLSIERVFRTEAGFSSKVRFAGPGPS